MADNMILFKRGTAATLPSTRNSNTLYFVTDSGALYLGQNLIADKTGNYAKAISDAIAGLDATVKDESGLVKITIVEEDGLLTSVTVDDAALDQKLADDLKAAKDYTDQEINKITTGAGYATTKYVDETVATATTDMATNAGVDAKIQALDANVTSIAPEETGKGIQVNVIEADGIITSVSVSGNYDKMYDASGAAATVLGNSNDAATANTVYGAKAAAAAAQSDATVAKTKIETFLGTITPDGSQDIIDTLAEINSYVGEHGEEFAALSERVTKVENGTTVVAKANADKDGNEFSATYAKTADISKATADMATNSSVNTKLADYTKTEDLGDLASKDKVAIDDLALDASSALSRGTQAYAAVTSDERGLAAAHTKAQKGIDDAEAARQLAESKATMDEVAKKYLPLTGGTLSGTLTVQGAVVTSVLNNGGALIVPTNENGTLATRTYVDGKIGSKKTETAEATGVYAAIQGATPNTVKDCVDAINALNAGTMAQKDDINAISTSINDIVEMLTWGTF